MSIKCSFSRQEVPQEICITRDQRKRCAEIKGNILTSVKNTFVSYLVQYVFYIWYRYFHRSIYISRMLLFIVLLPYVFEIPHIWAHLFSRSHRPKTKYYTTPRHTLKLKFLSLK